MEGVRQSVGGWTKERLAWECRSGTPATLSLRRDGSAIARRGTHAGGCDDGSSEDHVTRGAQSEARGIMSKMGERGGSVK